MLKIKPVPIKEELLSRIEMARGFVECYPFTTLFFLAVLLLACFFWFDFPGFVHLVAPVGP